MQGPEQNICFRERVLWGDRLLGVFLKTPSVHATEILADIGFDFVVVDQEHAPFDRHDLDAHALAARAGGIASLVRVPEANAAQLLGVLDLGFAGVIAPHISSVAGAQELVRACRFGGGTRGFSNSPRAGRYGGLTLSEHVQASDQSVTVIAMIENGPAVDSVEAIAAVSGLDALFVGRADLAVALGENSLSAEVVVTVVNRVLAACRKQGKRAMLHVGDATEGRSFLDRGASLFGSELTSLCSA